LIVIATVGWLENVVATTATMMYGHVETAEERSKHIESSWVTRGMKVGQVALGFGADDMGSVMIEENVVSVAGRRHRTRTDELVHLIRAQGKIPVQRDTPYREVKVLS
jgi:2-iminoacetate synthase ThiH